MEMAKKVVHPKNVEPCRDKRANGYAAVSVRRAEGQDDGQLVPVDGLLDVRKAE